MLPRWIYISRRLTQEQTERYNELMQMNPGQWPDSLRYWVRMAQAEAECDGLDYGLDCGWAVADWVKWQSDKGKGNAD